MAALDNGLNRISGSTRSTTCADDILVKSDRMSMAHSVEVQAAIPRSPHRRVCRNASA